MTPCPHPTPCAEPLFPARDYVTGDLFEVVRCEACGLIRTSPQPDPSAMGRYYPPAYHAVAGARRFPAVVVWLQRVLYRGRARAVERLAGGPGRVLDVGCGPGFLLDAFRRRGWDASGVELDDRSAAHARDVLGLRVETRLGDRWPWPDRSFDAVVLWHVLEHFPEPRIILEEASRVVRPGGVLMVGVPNFGSVEARAVRAGWFHLDVPRHVVHLTAEWLGAAIEDAGFDVARRSFLAAEFDAFSFVQSAENRLSLPHNLLYDLLRGRGARLGGGRARPAQAVAALALAAPLGILAVPATLAIGLAGLGSSVTLYAVRGA